MPRMTLSLFLSGALLSVVGCKDVAEPTDTGSVDTDTDTDSADTSVDDTDTADSGGDTAAECWTEWDEGTCYNTTLCGLPTTAADDSLLFLNQCTDAAYSLFDDSVRIPASTWKEGDALPVI